jgi:hypothetical protein
MSSFKKRSIQRCFKKIIDCCVNYRKYRNNLCGQNAGVSDAKVLAKCSRHLCLNN